MKKQRQRTDSCCPSLERQDDPFGPSYPQAAGRFLWYRLSFSGVVIFLVIIGTSSLPQDAVKCIEDEVLEGFRIVVGFYKSHALVGTALLTVMQLLVDFELVAMLALWYFKGNSFRYPLVLIFLGLNKMFLNLIFQIRPIDSSFDERILPSLVFGENFKNTYFFSGIIAFLLINFLELRRMGYEFLMEIQIPIICYCFFMLISMRQNFFMDVITAMVFAHLSFNFFADRTDYIDDKINSLLGSDTQDEEDE